jgi:DNA-directed RNA polymerase specialized sigma24 family protein
MMEAADAEVAVMAALAQGRPDAAQSLLERHGDLLWGLTAAVPSHAAREELACELFAALARESWWYTADNATPELVVALIARRRLRDWWRGQDAAAHDLAEPPAAHEPSDIETSDGDVRDALAALAERDGASRRTLMLVVGYALPPARVAEMTGLGEARIGELARELLIEVAGRMTDTPALGDVSEPSRRRLIELLADGVYRQLDDAERSELESLGAQVTDIDHEALERSAAAVTIAVTTRETMPDSVGARLMDQWRRWPGVTAPRTENDRRGTLTGDRTSRLAAYWLAAAGLVLAILGWWPALVGPMMEVEGPREGLQSLVASSDELVRAPWQGGDAAKGRSVSGEVVWSPQRQRGYMVLDNVPANDPREAQYQLWIFDGERPEYPVNGGVFNVPSGRESVIVPITPEVTVGDPSLFAVTRERPGGVVVSEREHVVLQAEPKQASSD